MIEWSFLTAIPPRGPMPDLPRDATRNPKDPIPRGPGDFFTPRFPEE